MGETWESINQWCEDTFGPARPFRVVARANEEMAELIKEADTLEWSDQLAIEAADVVIVLARIPGLWDAVQRKMAINRAREWRLTGDGCGYHIPKGAPHAD